MVRPMKKASGDIAFLYHDEDNCTGIFFDNKHTSKAMFQFQCGLETTKLRSACIGIQCRKEQEQRQNTLRHSLRQTEMHQALLHGRPRCTRDARKDFTTLIRGKSWRMLRVSTRTALLNYT